MERFFRLVSAMAPREVLLAAIVLVLAIGWLDHMTGPYVSFALIYLAPIALTTWRSGRVWGLTVAFLCTLIGLASDLASELASRGFIPYWNATARFGVFALVVAVLDGSRRSHEAQRRLARTDPVTGVANARHLVEETDRQIAGARRYGHPLALAYVDLDNFKAVNDTLGHSTGDLLLREVAMTLERNARPTDIVARLGGDEFAILLPHTDAAAGVTALTRMRTQLLAQMSERGWAVTVSVGIAEMNDHITTVDELVATADALMYDAKRAGKDLITWADSSLEPRFESRDDRPQASGTQTASATQGGTAWHESS